MLTSASDRHAWAESRAPREAGGASGFHGLSTLLGPVRHVGR
jgi:hypothetical protein